MGKCSNVPIEMLIWHCRDHNSNWLQLKMFYEPSYYCFELKQRTKTTNAVSINLMVALRNCNTTFLYQAEYQLQSVKLSFLGGIFIFPFSGNFFNYCHFLKSYFHLLFGHSTLLGQCPMNSLLSASGSVPFSVGLSIPLSIRL